MDGPLTGRQVAGYEFLEVIGRGATATVYRARQPRLGRDVAVKVLDPAFGDHPEYLERFEREGRAAAALDHPAIVTIHEAGEVEGSLYLAMRLVEGTTLAQRLEHAEGLEVAETAAILRPVAEALDHAHAAGVVHRDVKPSNIFLDARGDVFLGDFGVAGLVHGVARETVGAVGTADYMAPEQVEGAQAGPAADIYSLGCVIHECLTGSPPFERPTLLATLRAHGDEPVPPTGDEHVDRVLERALAKAPDARHERAAAVLDDLIGARPDGPPDEADVPPSAARRRVPALALAVVAALVVGAALLFATGDDDPTPADDDETTLDESGDVTGESPVDEPEGTADESSGEDTSDETAAATAVPERTTIEIGVDAAIESFDTLNPHIEPFNTQTLLGNVLPVLYVLDDDLAVTPSLAVAEPVVVNEDPFVVDYELRADATWDDGTPITSADAVATYDYIVELGNAAIGRQPYDSIERVDAMDARTVRVVYREPHYSYGLFLSANHPVLPASFIADHAALGGDPVDLLDDEVPFSGGPFSLSGADVGDGPGAGVELRFTRNDAWWGEPAPLERITIRNYEGLADTIDALESGDIEAAYLRRPTIGTAAELADIEATVTRVESVGPSAIALFANDDGRLGAETDVRRAVSTAVDREALATAVLGPAVGGAVTPLDSLAWLPQHADGRAPFAEVGGDPDEARRILAAAGWTLVEGDPIDRWERDGVELRLTLLVERQPPIGQLGASIPIQLFNDLEAAGIGLDVFAEDADVYAERVAQGDYDLRVVFTTTLTDPTANLVWFGGADRAFGYDGPAADLIVTAEAAVDLDERHALVDAAEADLLASGFALPLFQAAALTIAPEGMALPTPNGRLGGPLIDLAGWGGGP